MDGQSYKNGHVTLSFLNLPVTQFMYKRALFYIINYYITDPPTLNTLGPADNILHHNFLLPFPYGICLSRRRPTCHVRSAASTVLDGFFLYWVQMIVTKMSGCVALNELYLYLQCYSAITLQCNR